MKECIEAINAEAKSYRYPNLKPFFKLNSAKNEGNIEHLKKYIKEVVDPVEKGSIYGTLGFVGFICEKEQSGYIFDQLDVEKNKKTIAAALISMTGLQVPIKDYKRLIPFLEFKNSKVRHNAISAAEQCNSDWPLMEKNLIAHYDKTSNKWDKFWCVITFERVGTIACLPILRKAMNDITDGDGVNYILMAANRIAPGSMTELYLEVLKSRKDSFTKGLAMNGLYLGRDFSALEAVLDRAKNILKKKTTTPNIDHLEGCSEIQSAIMYLKLFESKEDGITDFFSWIKDKRMSYMDDQTQVWVKQNL